ncbi:hypothetical protein EPK99_19440 [Neorhizobium lilium]|uniref:Uncharacterized protein n=1 Tax=Neorhizobium lilium TaxID=2503024 RepID=A0A3S3REV8_9HYPH|nr:hypothetical protein [Neorhizobium lilium]RWX75855.1 hypothetical protein EPK99_19440 [Neorhizobium lilium]
MLKALMVRPAAFLAWLLVYLFMATTALAQQPAPSQAEVDRLQKAVQERDRALTEIARQLQEANSMPEDQRSAIAAAKAQALASYFQSQVSYNQNGDRLREYQQRIFSWQITAANWLLFVVMVVSLSGVVFAGYEMVATRRMLGSATTAPVYPAGAVAAPPQADGYAPAISTIVIEPTKIHITSAVIGIVILGLSLGFLYLFLKEVYAIKVFDITDTGTARVLTASAPDPNSQKPGEKTK